MKVFMLVVVGILLLAAGTAWAGLEDEGVETNLDNRRAASTVTFGSDRRRTSIGGIVFQGGYRCYTYDGEVRMVSLDVQGWQYFSTSIGIADSDTDSKTVLASIDVDGTEVWRQQLTYGAKPFVLELPIAGARSLTIYVKRIDGRASVMLGEPKLTKGRPVPSATVGQLVQLLLDLRASAKQSNNQPIVDYIDQRLAAIGIKVFETPNGVMWQMQ